MLDSIKNFFDWVLGFTKPKPKVEDTIGNRNSIPDTINPGHVHLKNIGPFANKE